jgi:uncharacterized repeat protein (TIGR01451 family)
MNERKIPLLPLLLLPALLLLGGIAWAQASGSYRLRRQLLSDAGGRMASTNYGLRSSMGQSSAIGASGSASYSLDAGYWHDQRSPPCPAPLSDVGIGGPTNGYTDTLYTFTGVITPSNATEPVTYTWSPPPESGQGTASAGYRWATPGVYTITMTVVNCREPVSDTWAVTIAGVIHLSKSVTPDGVACPGSQLTYAVGLYNPGPGDATALHFWDALPTATTYISDSLVGGAIYSPTARAISWSGDLPVVSDNSPGYVWEEVAYTWEDIGTSGIEVTGWFSDSDNGFIGPFPTGFDWPYFQLTQVYTQVYIASHGYVRLGKPAAYADPPTALPDPSFPNNVIAPYGDDLSVVQGSSHVYYQQLSHPTRFVVEYVQVQDADDSLFYTFQVILYPSGEIDFVYQDQAAADVIGLEDSSGARGVAYPTPQFSGNRSLRFTPQEFRRFVYQAQVCTDLSGSTTVTNTAILSHTCGTVERSCRIKVVLENYVVYLPLISRGE